MIELKEYPECKKKFVLIRDERPDQQFNFSKIKLEYTPCLKWTMKYKFCNYLTAGELRKLADYLDKLNNQNKKGGNKK